MGPPLGFRDTKLFIHPDQSVEMTGERYNLCGYRMPYLIPFVNRELDVNIDVSSPRPLTAEPHVTPVSRNDAFVTALTGALRPEQFTADDRERLLHSHGQTTTEEVSRVLSRTWNVVSTSWCGRSRTRTARPSSPSPASTGPA